MKWIAWGIVIMGIGSFVFALPHYLTSTYRAAGRSDSNLCDNHSNNNTLEVNLNN